MSEILEGLAAAGLPAALQPHGPEQLGFHACSTDLEDELIRALGVAGVEEVIAREGELASLQTLRRQPAQRTRLPHERLHRFLGARSGNKERFARLLVGAVALDRVPPVLHAVLDHALR